jgi:transcriptional regulator with XRE-family HTH domain
MRVETLFRRRVRELIQEKYRSLDRFYLETGFSKGHISDILRGKGSPTIPTLEKIAGALELEVRDLFIFPERSLKDRAYELLRKADDDAVRKAVRALSSDEGN